MLWYDFVLATAGVVVGLYIVIYYHDIAPDAGNTITGYVFISVLALALILEGCRATNSIFPILSSMRSVPA